MLGQKAPRQTLLRRTVAGETSEPGGARKARRWLLLVLLTILPLPRVAAQSDPAIDDELSGGEHHHPSTYYAAVWHEAAEPARLIPSDDPPSFAIPPGFRLADVEVWLDEGQRKYVGVARAASTGDHVLVGPLGAAEFEEARQEQRQFGQCLVGFEIWKEPQVLYAGVFQPGCGEEIFETGLDVVEFATRLHRYAGSYHLVDFETVLEDGELRVSGLWREGAEQAQTFALLGMSWETFHEWTHDLTEEGYGMVDLDVQFRAATQRAATGQQAGAGKPQPMLSGIWRQRQGMDWLGADYQWAHVLCAHSRLGLGFEHSGVPDGGGSCDPGDPDSEIVAPGAVPLRLAAFEVYPQWIWRLDGGQHGGTLHNSGSTGPP